MMLQFCHCLVIIFAVSAWSFAVLTKFGGCVVFCGDWDTGDRCSV